jgi:hypothetical protein
VVSRAWNSAPCDAVSSIMALGESADMPARIMTPAFAYSWVGPTPVTRATISTSPLIAT